MDAKPSIDRPHLSATWLQILMSIGVIYGDAEPALQTGPGDLLTI